MTSELICNVGNKFSMKINEVLHKLDIVSIVNSALFHLPRFIGEHIKAPGILYEK